MNKFVEGIKSFFFFYYFGLVMWSYRRAKRKMSRAAVRQQKALDMLSRMTGEEWPVLYKEFSRSINEEDLDEG